MSADVNLLAIEQEVSKVTKRHAFERLDMAGRHYNELNKLAPMILQAKKDHGAEAVKLMYGMFVNDCETLLPILGIEGAAVQDIINDPHESEDT